MSFLSKIFGSASSNATAVAAPSSRQRAKERLSVILASQRGSDLLAGIDMELFQKDVMEVVHVSSMLLSNAVY